MGEDVLDQRHDRLSNLFPVELSEFSWLTYKYPRTLNINFQKQNWICALSKFVLVLHMILMRYYTTCIWLKCMFIGKSFNEFWLYFFMSFHIGLVECLEFHFRFQLEWGSWHGGRSKKLCWSLQMTAEKTLSTAGKPMIREKDSVVYPQFLPNVCLL